MSESTGSMTARHREGVFDTHRDAETICRRGYLVVWLRRASRQLSPGLQPYAEDAVQETLLAILGILKEDSTPCLNTGAEILKRGIGIVWRKAIDLAKAHRRRAGVPLDPDAAVESKDPEPVVELITAEVVSHLEEKYRALNDVLAAEIEGRKESERRILTAVLENAGKPNRSKLAAALGLDNPHLIRYLPCNLAKQPPVRRATAEFLDARDQALGLRTDALNRISRRNLVDAWMSLVENVNEVKRALGVGDDSSDR